MLRLNPEQQLLEDDNQVNEAETLTKRKFPWWIVNLLIGLSIPIAFIWLIPVFGIVVRSLPVQIIVNIILIICYNRYIKKGVGKKLLYAMRAIAISLTALILLSTAVLFNFDYQKSAYQLKKFVFTNGVGSKESCEQILPDRMPKECEDYLIITQGQGIAQDYHPSLYLAFHTDEATLREYEQKMKENGGKQKDYNVTYEDYLAEWELTEKELNNEWMMSSVLRRYLNNKGFPPHAFERLKPVHMTDFDENTIVYYFEAYYDYGCMLDYDSGLAVFWT